MGCGRPPCSPAQAAAGLRHAWTLQGRPRPRVSSRRLWSSAGLGDAFTSGHLDSVKRGGGSAQSTPAEAEPSRLHTKYVLCTDTQPSWQAAILKPSRCAGVTAAPPLVRGHGAGPDFPPQRAGGRGRPENSPGRMRFLGTGKAVLVSPPPGRLGVWVPTPAAAPGSSPANPRPRRGRADAKGPHLCQPWARK